MDLHSALKPLHILTTITGHCFYKYDKTNAVYLPNRYAVLYNILLGTFLIAFLNILVSVVEGMKISSVSMQIYFGCLIVINVVYIIIGGIKVKSIVNLLQLQQKLDQKLMQLLQRLDSTKIRRYIYIAIFTMSTNFIVGCVMFKYAYNFTILKYSVMYVNVFSADVVKLQFLIMMFIVSQRLGVLIDYSQHFNCMLAILITDKGKDKWVLETVERIYTTYNDICNICLETNKMFGIQILLFYLHALLAAVIEIYFCYITEHLSIIMLISFWQWIIWRLLYLWIIAYLHHSIQRQVQMMTSTIHKLLNKAKDPELKLMLKIFVKKELNRNFSFTICGLFPADLTMIQTVVATVTTYVLLLVQLRAARST